MKFIEHLLQEGLARTPPANIEGLSRRQVQTLIELMAKAVTANIHLQWENEKEEAIPQGYKTRLEFFLSDPTIEDDMSAIMTVIHRDTHAIVKDAM